MMSRARLPFISLLLVLITQAAAAQSVSAPSPFYVSVGAGLSRLQNTTNTYAASAPRTNVDVGFEPGWAVSGAVGRYFGDHARIEFEVNHRGADVQSVTPGSSPGGEMDHTGFMANALYDFTAGLPIRPYVGLGVGVAIVRQTVGSGGVQLTRATDTVVAYQGIVGFSFPFASGLFGTVDYRYLATGAPTFTANGGIPYDASYHSHAVLVGIRVPM